MRLFALAQADEVQDLRRIGERVLDFFRQVGVAVLADRDMIDISNLRADRIQTALTASAGKPA